MEKVVPLTEAAQACGVSWYRLRTALLKAELHGERVDGVWLVSLADARRWAERQAAPAAAS